jgi:hypothetical protein
MSALVSTALLMSLGIINSSSYWLFHPPAKKLWVPAPEHCLKNINSCLHISKQSCYIPQSLLSSNQNIYCGAGGSIIWLLLKFTVQKIACPKIPLLTALSNSTKTVLGWFMILNKTLLMKPHVCAINGAYFCRVRVSWWDVKCFWRCLLIDPESFLKAEWMSPQSIELINWLQTVCHRYFRRITKSFLFHPLPWQLKRPQWFASFNYRLHI